MSGSSFPAQAADRIAASLRERITAGILPPATALRDAALAAEFEVSRNTVREAFRMLRHDGLVDHQLHRGVVVRTLTVDDVHDIYRARQVVEIRAVQESALAGSHALEAAGATVDRAEHAVATGEFSAVGTASLAFHQALVALLGSRSLDEFFATVVARLRLAFAVMSDEGEFQRPWVPRDRQIWQLLVSGRRDQAETELQRYLDDSHRMVTDVVRAHQLAPATGRT